MPAWQAELPVGAVAFLIISLPFLPFTVRMFRPYTLLFLPLATAATLLLSSCSDSASGTDSSEREATPTKPPQYPYGSQVD